MEGFFAPGESGHNSLASDLQRRGLGGRHREAVGGAPLKA